MKMKKEVCDCEFPGGQIALLRNTLAHTMYRLNIKQSQC